MKLVTWNVNSINMRLSRVVAFLEKQQPDVLCLQELKCLEEKFPFEAFTALHYHALVHGQKTYNGVAILSKTRPELVHKGFEDPAARLICARVKDINVISAYVPNGQEVGSEKFRYKLDWLMKFKAHLSQYFKPTDALCIAGDFNIAPEDKDVHNADLWRGKILFSEPEKQALRDLCEWGLVDTFRLSHPEGGHYSWWDYRNLAFQMNNGLRIDFVLASETLAKRCNGAHIFRDERKAEKPSDHAPVMAEFQL